MKRLFSASVFFLLVACSGRVGELVPQGHPPVSSVVRSHVVSIAFSLVGGLPKSGPAHKVVSLTILPYGAHVRPQIWNLSKTACLAKQTCNFEVNTRGLSLFLVRSYEKRDGAGEVLSTTIVDRSNLTLVPTVRQAEVTVTDPNPVFGKKQTLFLASVGLDEAGDAIVGPAPYNRSIELYVQGNMHISTTKVTNAIRPVSLTYNGGYQYASVSIPKKIVAFGRQPYDIIRPQFKTAVEQASPLRPGYFAKASDGSVWLTDGYECLVAKMDATFRTTPYKVPSACPGPPTTGPDGNVWFTVSGGVGYVTPSGAVTAYANLVTASLAAITSGPDGKLWMVDNSNGDIYSATTSGVITKASYSLNKPYSDDIVTGPDGNLWIPYAYGGSDGFAVVSTAGTLVHNYKTIVIPPVIVSGGYVYGRSGYAGTLVVAKWNAAGKIVAKYPAPFGIENSQLALGTDGAIWFEVGPAVNGKITSFILGRVSSVGGYCEINVPVPEYYALADGDIGGLIVGSDGALYYNRGPYLGKITLPSGS